MKDMIPAWIGETLQPIEKLAVHKRGLRHKAVSVFVVVAGAVLIQKRADTKYHTPGLWANTCCTHPNWEENPVDCAARRLKEELGITGLTLIHKDQIEYRADVGNGLVEHEIVDLFLATPDKRPEMRANPDEVQDVQWVLLPELEQMITANPNHFTPWLRIYLERHKASVFGPT